MQKYYTCLHRTSRSRKWHVLGVSLDGFWVFIQSVKSCKVETFKCHLCLWCSWTFVHINIFILEVVKPEVDSNVTAKGPHLMDPATTRSLQGHITLIMIEASEQ